MASFAFGIWVNYALLIFFFFLPAFFSGLVAAPNTQLVLFWLWAHTVTSARTYLSMKMPRCQQALTCPHGYSESPADGQAVGVYRGTSPGLLHIWNKEASLGLPSVFTALLFFHTPRKILPKHTFQTHQLNMGGKKMLYFSTVNLAPSTKGGGQNNKSLKLAWISGGDRRVAAAPEKERKSCVAGWLTWHMSLTEVRNGWWDGITGLYNISEDTWR